LITGPRLVGNTTFRGCFVAGAELDGNPYIRAVLDVDTIAAALVATGSWDDDNITKPEGKRQDIVDCIDAAKANSIAGDEFIFYFSGHGGDGHFPDAGEAGEGGGNDNHILIADTTPGTRDRITDDDLSNMLDGFKKGVTIVVILDSCLAHGFKDGVDDLASVTQVNGAAAPAGPRIALIAASSPAEPTIGSSFTTKLSEGLGVMAGNFKADANKDGVVSAMEAEDYAHHRNAGATPKCDDEVASCPGGGCGTTSSYNGPFPPDIDACPTEAGPLWNYGCPTGTIPAVSVQGFVVFLFLAAGTALVIRRRRSKRMSS